MTHNRIIANLANFTNKKYVGANGRWPVNDNIKIKLNAFDQIIDNQWNDLPNQHDNVELDKCIIMSNHIHGIINVVGAGSPRPDQISSNIDNQNDYSNGHGNRAPTIGNIITYFKYQITKRINHLKKLLQNKVIFIIIVSNLANYRYCKLIPVIRKKAKK